MNTFETYEFDRLGYIVIPNLLTKDQVRELAAAIDTLEEDAVAQLGRPPDKKSAWGPVYRHNIEKGYYVSGARDEGKTVIIEDFFNADPAFDVLVDHPATMAYIGEIVPERPTINNSEIAFATRVTRPVHIWEDRSPRSIAIPSISMASVA